MSPAQSIQWLLDHLDDSNLEEVTDLTDRMSAVSIENPKESAKSREISKVRFVMFLTTGECFM